MNIISRDQIKRIIKGDEEAFKIIFNDFYPKLVGFAMKYHDDIMVAEDVVSEVFKNIWEKRDKILEVDSLNSFLYTSVRNRILNHLRHINVQRNYQEKILLESDNQFYEDNILEQEVHHKLYKALQNLPEKRRKVFELSVIYGWKEKEIAEDLGISVNTIKTHKKRALKELRDKLQNLFNLLFYF